MFYCASAQRRALLGGGAGRDKTPRAGFCSGVENTRKCRRIPAVQCTLCWARFVPKDSLAGKRTHRQTDPTRFYTETNFWQWRWRTRATKTKLWKAKTWICFGNNTAKQTKF